MNKPGVPAPGLEHRFGRELASMRGVRFQELRAKEMMNRLSGQGMPFGWTLNPFRGCEIGCRYCYARPTHEYLGHSGPEEFEARIYVKRGDMGGLRAALRRARDTGQEVAIGTATDPYQPAELRFSVTRGVLRAAGSVPGLRLGITTKSTSITRDLELLRQVAATCELTVNISLISLDADLLRRIEPRAPRPDLRLRAMRVLAEAGIHTRIFVMPILPLITDGEPSLRALLEAARAAGAREAVSNVLFLRGSTREYFLEFAGREFPWVRARYEELYRGSAYAPREYRDRIERLVRELAAKVGLDARGRGQRVREERPRPPRQLALIW